MALLLSRTAWIAVGLGARLLIIAVLIIAVKLQHDNHVSNSYNSDAYYNLHGLTYARVAAFVGMGGALLQIPVAVYLLFKSRKMMASLLVLNISMYADLVVSAVLVSGVGAGFGATNDALNIINVLDWKRVDQGDATNDLGGYYGRANVAMVFLLIGTLISMGASVITVRLRASAGGGDDA
ncbi:hypothetical protein ACP4OV_005918 [Aristida adscensionis]